MDSTNIRSRSESHHFSCYLRDVNETDMYERVMDRHYSSEAHTVLYMIGAKFAAMISRLTHTTRLGTWQIFKKLKMIVPKKGEALTSW